MHAGYSVRMHLNIAGICFPESNRITIFYHASSERCPFFCLSTRLILGYVIAIHLNTNCPHGNFPTFKYTKAGNGERIPAICRMHSAEPARYTLTLNGEQGHMHVAYGRRLVN